MSNLDGKCYQFRIEGNEYDVTLKFKKSNKRHTVQHHDAQGFMSTPLKSNECIIETTGGWSITIDEESMKIINPLDDLYFNKNVAFLDCSEYGDALVITKSKSS